MWNKAVNQDNRPLSQHNPSDSPSPFESLSPLHRRDLQQQQLHPRVIRRTLTNPLFPAAARIEQPSPLDFPAADQSVEAARLSGKHSISHVESVHNRNSDNPQFNIFKRLGSDDDQLQTHRLSNPVASLDGGGQLQQEVEDKFVPSSVFFQEDLSKFLHSLIDMSSATAFFTSTITLVAQLGMIFGGVVVFIPQYLAIRSTRNAEGFSTHVCLILLIANLLRLCFWVAVRFETPLLLQSLLVTSAMLAMLELCVKCRLNQKSGSSKQKEKRFLDLNPEHFWNWTYFSDYVQFLGIFFAFFLILTKLLENNDIYVETLGFVALSAEALLLIPQLARNFTRRSTEGLSINMVLMMLCGDLFKTAYFVLRHVPSQFWICSSLQCSIDMSILFQVFYYGSSPTVVETNGAIIPNIETEMDTLGSDTVSSSSSDGTTANKVSFASNPYTKSSAVNSFDQIAYKRVPTDETESNMDRDEF